MGAYLLKWLDICYVSGPMGDEGFEVLAINGPSYNSGGVIANFILLFVFLISVCPVQKPMCVTSLHEDH